MWLAAAERVKESSPSFEAGGGGDVAVIQVGKRHAAPGRKGSRVGPRAIGLCRDIRDLAEGDGGGLRALPARVDGRHRVEVGLSDRRGGVGEGRRRGGDRPGERRGLARRDAAIDVVARRRACRSRPGEVCGAVDVARCLRVVDRRDGKARRGVDG